MVYLLCSSLYGLCFNNLWFAFSSTLFDCVGRDEKEFDNEIKRNEEKVLTSGMRWSIPKWINVGIALDVN
jgi:hypothetical protein